MGACNRLSKWGEILGDNITSFILPPFPCVMFCLSCNPADKRQAKAHVKEDRPSVPSREALYAKRIVKTKQAFGSRHLWVLVHSMGRAPQPL